MRLGIVTRWNPKLRIGVIVTAEGNFFLHENEILSGWPKVGCDILFEESKRKPLPGRMPEALNVLVLP